MPSPHDIPWEFLPETEARKKLAQFTRLTDEPDPARIARINYTIFPEKLQEHLDFLMREATSRQDPVVPLDRPIDEERVLIWQAGELAEEERRQQLIRDLHDPAKMDAADAALTYLNAQRSMRYDAMAPQQKLLFPRLIVERLRPKVDRSEDYGRGSV